MTTQIKKPQAIFPNIPRDPVVIDLRTGRMRPPWLLFFSQLSQALQTNFKPEGIAIPQQTAANIVNLKSSNSVVGNIVYDSDNKQFKGIVLVTPGTPTMPPETAIKTFTIT